ncbi:hypothetical protein BJV77DRAFT_1104371 [Russula vinacea]|nr:hypothetical protein BJV77DRAFT_1104371 [Russula vinacea]
MDQFPSTSSGPNRGKMRTARGIEAFQEDKASRKKAGADAGSVRGGSKPASFTATAVELLGAEAAIERHVLACAVSPPICSRCVQEVPGRYVAKHWPLFALLPGRFVNQRLPSVSTQSLIPLKTEVEVQSENSASAAVLFVVVIRVPASRQDRSAWRGFADEEHNASARQCRWWRVESGNYFLRGVTGPKSASTRHVTGLVEHLGEWPDQTG